MADGGRIGIMIGGGCVLLSCTLGVLYVLRPPEAESPAPAPAPTPAPTTSTYEVQPIPEPYTKSTKETELN